MKTYMLVLFAAMGALLLLGATGCGDTGQTTNLRPFIGGAQAMTMQFDQYAPPMGANIGEEFNIVIVLQNMGEYTVPAGDYFVKVKGFSPEDFNVANVNDLRVTPTEALQGNELNPDTGEVIDSYPVYVTIPENYMISYTGGLAGNQQFTITADVCYTYATTANALLCVKEFLTRTQDTSVCTLAGPQPIASSAGPILISNFNEYSGGADTVRFSFAISEANTGGFASMRGSECSKQQSDSNMVYVTVDTGLTGLSCNGLAAEGTRQVGYVKLSGGTRAIQCTQNLAGQHSTDYQKVITITAEYDYQQSLSTNVLIKHIE